MTSITILEENIAKTHTSNDICEKQSAYKSSLKPWFLSNIYL